MLLASGLQSQAVFVRTLEIEGNKKTRDYIIQRELDFAVGDSLALIDMAASFERNRNNLINTGLFNDVVINIEEWDVDERVIDVTITVTETWYIYVVPIIELADRNFNVWWEEFNGALNRLNLGVKILHLNATGNNDRFKANVQFGYTPKLEFDYDFPYLDRKQTIRASINLFRATNKETYYRTEENKPVFVTDNDRRLLRRNRLQFGLSYRPNLYVEHTLTTEYQGNLADPLVSQDLNPDFFLDGRVEQQMLNFNYEFRYDNRDVQIYPTKGWLTGFQLDKKGVGIFDDINTFDFIPFLEKNFWISPKLSVTTAHKAKLGIVRGKQPYYQYRGLGYDRDIVRGYELYVVDGRDYYVSRNTAKVEIFSKELQLGKWMLIPPFRIMPLRIYLGAHLDAGQAFDPFYAATNNLSNRWLTGYGGSVAFVLYNNFAGRIEFSVNHLNEKGIFLHNKFSF